MNWAQAFGPAWVWVAILGVAATTVATRCGFLLLGRRAQLPETVERALRYAPAAALAALIGPEVLAPGAQLHAGLDNPRVLGTLAGAALFVATRSMVWTIVGGMAAFTVVRLWA